MNLKNTTQIEKLKPIKELALALKADGQAGKDAGIKLATDAASYGLTMREYITLAGADQSDHTKDGLNAFEKLLVELNIPVRNDYESGVSMQAASDTFQTFPGTRALFPQVIDEILRWSNRQDQFEKVAPMISNSRTINGVEMVSTVVNDDSKDRDSYSISEMGRIPVRTIRTSETTVKIFKHGSAIRTSYEFNRRAALDIVTPYLNRIARELELSKVKAATSVLVNGDGVNGAAPVVLQNTFDAATGVTSIVNKLNFQGVLAWLVSRAKLGAPIDTVVMNWDTYLQWVLMFSVPQANNGPTQGESLQKSGVNAQVSLQGVNLALVIKPVISSSAPANKLIGYSVGDTLEELVEAGSNIQETERAITTQTITVVKTENTGYRLVYGDTRSILSLATS